MSDAAHGATTACAAVHARKLTVAGARRITRPAGLPTVFRIAGRNVSRAWWLKHGHARPSIVTSTRTGELLDPR